MKPYYSEFGVSIYNGDSREVLPQLDSESVNCCVTSPPYWGLRDYGMLGQLGLEKTPEEYVEKMVALFREVRRVLRDDGVLFLNLGDCYHNGDKGGYHKDRVVNPNSMQASNIAGDFVGAPNRKPHPLLKPKDLVGVPWMVAFALRADGWYLRQDNIWAKPNGMPESVEDRTTRSHEYVFLLSKSEKYFYNAEAVRTAPKASSELRLARGVGENHKGVNGAPGQTPHGPNQPRPNRRRDAMEREQQMANGANLRDVWWISPAQYAEAHFAVMPEKLAAICVAAGCPNGGTVIDPFFGAGTTGAVCQQQHLNCIGIELSRPYCEIAARRLSQGVLNFGGVP